MGNLIYIFLARAKNIKDQSNRHGDLDEGY